MGIFNKSDEPVQQIPRNTFDGSFSNSGTYQFGKLYPVFCKEVIPGDTMEIDTTFGLRFMPTAFPLQSKVKANIHYFYVRNRNLWKDWMNFIGKTGSPDAFPTLSLAQKSRHFQTGSLGDYLGLPTNRFVNVSSEFSQALSFQLAFQGNNDSAFSNYQSYSTYRNLITSKGKFTNVPLYFTNTDVTKLGYSLSQFSALLPQDYHRDHYDFYFAFDDDPEHNLISQLPTALFIAHGGVYTDSSSSLYNSLLSGNTLPVTFSLSITTPTNSFVLSNIDTYIKPFISVYSPDFQGMDEGPQNTIEIPCETSVSHVVNGTKTTINFTIYPPSDLKRVLSDMHFDKNISLSYGVRVADGVLYNILPHLFYSFDFDLDDDIYKVNDFITNFSVLSAPSQYSSSEANSLGSDLDQITVSALPFRAYESIYNSFYRDQRNNPYVVNGVQDPNVYIPTTDGGIDNNDYDFHYANWEQDCFTSAVPSPQQGTAPLVGMTSTGTATFLNDDGTPVSVKLTTAEDASTIIGANDLESLPESVRRSVVNMSTEGISINDFRAVNSLQRWLETNMRRGFKYKDQLMSHFGVDASYQTLDMPEFLGGVSQMVNINEVTNQTETSDSSALGSYAGQMRCLGQANHKIHNYCDEHGFIIGILHVIPVPSYSQILPKFFGKTTPLDYYFPEFGHIGYQPITVGEITPLNAIANKVPLSTTFGYQRPWYDYLANVDEIHGLFRTNLSSFMLTRVFGNVPTLSEDFLLCKPETLNDVFTVNYDSDGNPVDPILGQIYFDVKMKRPIPRFGIAKLE